MNKKNHLYFFFIPYIFVAVTLFFLILIYKKGELHLILNSFHASLLDFFFTYITEFGATIPFLIAVIYLFHRLNKSFYILVTLLINSLITNGLKLVFHEPRPKTFFAQNFPDIPLQFVDGMRIYLKNGFPSGHTSAVFAVMLCIALISKNPLVSAICCIIAIATAYSRVYLSQHFGEDVLLGSVVGITTALAFYPLYLKSQNNPWMNKSIVSVFNK